MIATNEERIAKLVADIWLTIITSSGNGGENKKVFRFHGSETVDVRVNCLEFRVKVAEVNGLDFSVQNRWVSLISLRSRAALLLVGWRIRQFRGGGGLKLPEKRDQDTGDYQYCGEQ